MKVEDQVCSLESAKKLKELGVKQESLFWWSYHPAPKEPKPRKELCFGNEEIKHRIDWQMFSAFTIAELGEILKDWTGMISYFDFDAWNNVHGLNREGEQGKNWYVEEYGFYEKNEVECRAKMLIYLIENSLLDSKIL